MDSRRGDGAATGAAPQTRGGSGEVSKKKARQQTITAMFAGMGGMNSGSSGNEAELEPNNGAAEREQEAEQEPEQRDENSRLSQVPQLLDGSMPIPEPIGEIPFLFYSPPTWDEVDDLCWPQFQAMHRVMMTEIHRAMRLYSDTPKLTDEAMRAIQLWIEIGALAMVKPDATEARVNVAGGSGRSAETAAVKSLQMWLDSLTEMMREGIFDDTDESRSRLQAVRARVRRRAEKWLQIREEQCDEPGEDDIERTKWNERVKRKVESCVGKHQITKAIQILMAEGPALEPTTEIVQQLIDLHPPGRGVALPDMPHLPQGCAAEIAEGELGRLPPGFYCDGKSPGPTGWKTAWLLPLSREATTGKVLTIIMNFIVKGEIPADSRLRYMFTSSCLVGLPKPGCDTVRPVAMGDCFVRVAAKLALSKIGMTGVISGLIMEEIQLGVMVESGVERALGTAQMTWEKAIEAGLSPTAVLWDGRNAYNTRDRPDMFTILYNTPQLASIWGLARMLYEQSTPLLVKWNGITVAHLLSRTGVRQGCVLSALLYALSMQKIFVEAVTVISKENIKNAMDGVDNALTQRLRRALEGTGVRMEIPTMEPTAVAIMDDNTGIAEGVWALIGLKAMKEDCTPERGIYVNWEKTLILTKSEDDVTPEMAAIAQELKVTIVHGRTKLVGGYIGTGDSELGEAIFDREVGNSQKGRKCQQLFKRMAEIKLSSQSTYLIITNSHLARLGYLSRVTRPTILERTAVRFDELAMGAMQQMLGMTAEEKESEEVAQAIRRPVGLSGLGLRSIARTSDMAFLAGSLSVCVGGGEATMQDMRNSKSTRTYKAMTDAWRNIQMRVGRNNAMLQKLHRILQLPAVGLTVSRSERLHDLDALLKTVATKTKDIALAIEGLMDKELAEAAKERRAARKIAVEQAVAKMLKTTEAVMKEQRADRQYIEATLAKQRELGQKQIEKADAPQLRLQFLFTRMVERAEADEALQEAATRADNASLKAQDVARAMIGSSEEMVGRRRDAARYAMRCRVEQVRMLTVRDVSTGLLWNTVPADRATRVNSHTFNLCSRIRVGLTPVPGIQHCAYKGHNSAEYTGMPRTRNGAYQVDPAHWLSCRQCLTAIGTATTRHDTLCRALSHCAGLAGCDRIWAPAMVDTMTRCRAHDETEFGRNATAATAASAVARPQQPTILSMMSRRGGGGQATNMEEQVRSRNEDGELGNEARASTRQNEAREEGGVRERGLAIPAVATTSMATAAAAMREGIAGTSSRLAEENAAAVVARAQHGGGRGGNAGSRSMLCSAGLKSLSANHIQRGFSGVGTLMRASTGNALDPPPSARLPLSLATTAATHNSRPMTAASGRVVVGRGLGNIGGAGSGNGGNGTRLIPTGGSVAGGMSEPRRGSVTSSSVVAAVSPPENNHDDAIAALDEGHGPGPSSSSSEDDNNDGSIRIGHGRADRLHRERQAEGDLGITGPSFDRYVLVDMHVISPLVPSRLVEWANVQLRRSRGRNVRNSDRVQKDIAEAEQFKRLHYRQLAANLLRKDKEEIDTSDPLAAMKVELVPAVMTPFGNVAPALDDLLQRLAQQAIEMEDENNPAGGKDTSSAIYHKMRVRWTHNRYRKIMAVAMARAVAASFSARTQRVNVSSRHRQHG
jgi:hypothetical protein